MQGNKKLLYSLVARGTVVLAEHSIVAGNVNVISLRILEQLSQEDTRVSYTQDRHQFHVYVQDGITFLCVAEEMFGKRLPFAFLEDVKTRFFNTYAHSCMEEAVAYELNTDFSPVLAQRMHFFATDPQADALGRVQGQLAEVKSIMMDNIEKVLDRGEVLDVLVDKTDALSSEAFNFRRAARRVRHVMWWRNVKMWAMVGGVAAVVIFFMVAAACSWSFSKC